MKIDLTGKVLVVTGGSEGIGASIAGLAAKCGAQVALFSRDETEMEKVRLQITDEGGEALIVPVDVTSDEDVEKGFAVVCERWGRLDLIVANAGTNGTWAPIDEITPEEWSSTMDVNLTGTYRTIHFGVPYLKKQGSGSIVIVSSINGTRTFSNEGASAYGASKAGQLALGQMLALELSRSSIRINVICPGAVDTDIHGKTEKRHLDQISVPAEYPDGNVPLEKDGMGESGQVAQLAVFLLSDAASHITGTPVWIDGGQSLLT